MIKYLSLNDLVKSDKDLIQSIYHFSIADYIDPDNINFGKLRVLNDEIFKPNGGFDLHLHRNLEILSYIIEGELTHKDSLNNFIAIKKGDLQFMSTGKGIYHSEFNKTETDLRLLQIWILPSTRNLEPQHSIIDTNKYIIPNQLFKAVSLSDAPIIINQDINLYILKLDSNRELDFEVSIERQAYLVQIEGSSNINGFTLREKDALQSVEDNLNIKSNIDSHILIIEMRKG